MYSTGLPVLYPFACIFFFVLYWVYKGLLLKYYARTTKFNEEIPIESVNYIKFGIFLHIFIGSIMLSNNSFYHSEQDLVELDFSLDSYSSGNTMFIAAYFKRLLKGE